MRKLHVVGYAADQGGIVLSVRRGAKSGSYLLPLDDSLLAQIARARRRDGDLDDPETTKAAPRSGSASALTPREIQARLRAGHSLEEVAEEAGVGVDWVDRFAAPVLAEQAAAVARAGRAVLHTPRKGPSDRPLEASVRRNLAERGIVMGEGDFDNAWSARQLIDTDWLVSFRYRNRGRLVTAEWMLNVTNGALTTRNRLGADLGYVEAGHRVTAGSMDQDAVEEPAADRAGGGRPAVDRKASARRPQDRSAPVPEVPAPAVPKPAAVAAIRRSPVTPKPAPGMAAVVKAPAAVIPKTPVQREPVAGTESRKVAAAPRQAAVSSVSLPVPTPAESPAPAGAHFARKPVRPRAVRPKRAAASADTAELPRLPLDDLDPPDTEAIRLGNPD